MKTILRDLIDGKWAIGYTMETLANMVPRDVKWLSNLPILGGALRITQFFWFITKIIFFALVISWFKPQYNHTGARIILILVTFGIVFFAWWIIKNELDRRSALK